jgi:type I restriction enzyme, S subunit
VNTRLLVPLSRVLEVVSGFGFPLEHQGDNAGTIPFFKVGDMNLPANRVEMREWNNAIDSKVLALLRARTYPKGTVIFPKIGAAIATGKKRILSSEATFDNNVMGLIPGHFVDPRYLYYWTLTFDFTKISNIGPVPSIRKSTVEKVEFPLLPLLEQERIVEILDQADRLRQKRNEADRIADRILPALFVESFGDPSTNPKGWIQTILDEVVTETQYGTSVKANQEKDGTAVIRMNNIDSDGYISITDLKFAKLDLQVLQQQLLSTGDILFNRTNSRELVGKTGIWLEPIPAVPASYLIRVRVNKEKVLPEFIWAFMNTRFIKTLLFNKARRAIGMANINARELRSLPCYVPEMNVQETFASNLKSLFGVRNNREKSKKQLDSLFSLCLFRAFNGDVTAKWREAHMKEILEEMEIIRRKLSLDN